MISKMMLQIRQVQTILALTPMSKNPTSDRVAQILIVGLTTICPGDTIMSNVGRSFKVYCRDEKAGPSGYLVSLSLIVI